MEVVGRTRLVAGLAALVVAVALLVGVLAWRIVVALPAPWVSPSAVAPTSLAPTGPGGADWSGTVPTGWTVPKDTYGSRVALVDANKNRISGDTFRQTPERTCAYLVDQAMSWQKYTRTDLTDRRVGTRTVLAVRLAASNENQEIRCFAAPAAGESWYLMVTYRPQDAAAVEAAFDQFARSFTPK